jgi:hypothetical protein
MAGFNVSGGYGAGGGADMLQQILKQKALEFAQAQQIRMAEQRLKEEARQANQSTATTTRGQDITSRGQDLSHELGLGNLDVARGGLAERTREFDAEAPGREAGVKLTGAQTGELLRKPIAEQESRDFTTQRDKTQHGYQLGEIGATGANQMRLLNARVAGAGPEAQTQKEQNEVSDSLALIDQIRKDPALSSSVGPLEGRGVGYATAGPEGYTRVKALHDNLVGKLQLAQAGKLKGQGQISDKEREMLRNAATALDRKLGDKDYLNELGKVEAQFKRMQQGGSITPSPATGGGKMIRARDPQGNLHEAPAGTPLPSGWKPEGGD